MQSLGYPIILWEKFQISLWLASAPLIYKISVTVRSSDHNTVLHGTFVQISSIIWYAEQKTIFFLDDKIPSIASKISSRIVTFMQNSSITTQISSYTSVVPTCVATHVAICTSMSGSIISNHTSTSLKGIGSSLMFEWL